MSLLARLVLEIAAALIALGGLYDLLTPKLPANLVALCGGNEQACRLARELLRALGGALFAVGAAVSVLVSAPNALGIQDTLLLVLILVVPAEGINTICMYRVRSPWYVPLGFLLLTGTGVLLAWPR
jgi:hypothetical protein